MIVDQKTSLDVHWTVLHQRTHKTDIMLEFYNNPDWAKGYDVVVHNECFANITDDNYINSVIQPHIDGVPAVLVHCSMHYFRAAPTVEKWWELCGVYSRSHDKHKAFEVQITAPEHEIMKGMDNWTTPQGELYIIEKAYPTMTPLAQSKSVKTGKMEANIWVNEYGPNKTRIFATTIGHHNETMMQEQFMEMFTRGFIWATGKAVAENLR